MTQPDSSGSPRAIPLEIKLRIRDAYGREKTYATTWEAVPASAPGRAGATGLTLTTGLTDIDGAGVLAECTVRVGI